MEKKTILVTDDEGNIRLLVSRILGRDYIVLGAASGREAIEIAHRRTPDLILMDVMMPKMDGYAACSTIKKDPFTREIPVVMVSTLGHEIDVRLSQEVGASGYITKPFEPQALRDTINRCLRSPTWDAGRDASGG